MPVGQLLSFPEPGFSHESHLAWDQLDERGDLLPGWVTRGSQVKAVNEHITLRTYSGVVSDAPLPDGFSWANLDLCGGWSRGWLTTDGDRAYDSAALPARVMSGKKIAGSTHGYTNASWLAADWLERIVEKVESTPGYTVNVSRSAHGSDTARAVWIAPDNYLGEVVDLAPIREFYAIYGFGPHALDGAEDIYLPAQGTDFAFDAHGALITGLILGYPPASTLSIVLRG